MVSATNTTGHAAKVFKSKARTIHSFADFAGFNDYHGPNEVCCMFACFLFLGWVSLV